MVATTRITTLLETEIPGFTPAKAGLTFAQLGVDSFGMLELRVAIEHALGSPIADAAWIGLETPEQLLVHVGERPGKVHPSPPSQHLALPGPYVVRRVEPGDARELEGFSRRLWPRRDPEALARRWWLKASPAQCFAAFAVGGSIAGVCGAREQRVFVRGAPARAVGICDWFVDPGARGSGIGRRLAEAALGTAEVGWSSSLSAEAEKAFLRLGFGPEPAQRMPLFLTPSVVVAARNALSLGGSLRVEARSFGLATLDSIASEIQQAVDFRLDARFTGGARDLDAWRSHLELVPGRTYQAYLLRDRQARLVALAVSRRLARGAFPRLGPTRLTLVVDLLCDLSQRDRLTPLLRRMAFDAVRAGSELLLVPAYDPPVHETLAKAGFLSAQASWMNLRVPRLSTRFMTRQSIAPGVATSEWRMTAFDCDFDLGLGADAEP
jgi:acyl carrier protein/GNAT superfamily N-acetyltransferase